MVNGIEGQRRRPGRRYGKPGDGLPEDGLPGAVIRREQLGRKPARLEILGRRKRFVVHPRRNRDRARHPGAPPRAGESAAGHGRQIVERAQHLLRAQRLQRAERERRGPDPTTGEREAREIRGRRKRVDRKSRGSAGGIAAVHARRMMRRSHSTHRLGARDGMRVSSATSSRPRLEGGELFFRRDAGFGAANGDRPALHGEDVAIDRERRVVRRRALGERTVVRGRQPPAEPSRLRRARRRL